MIAKVRVDAAIICDDVRREITSKVLLVGVWPLELAIADYPASIEMVLHIEGEVLETGRITPRLFVRDESGGTLYDSDKSHKMDEGKFIKGRFSIDFNVFFIVNKTSELSFVMTMGGEEYQVARRRVDTIANFMSQRQEEIKNKFGTENED